LSYVLAFIAGWLAYRHLARMGYSDIPPDKVGDFITWLAVFGVLIGGRLGFILFYDFDAFQRDPLMVLRVWEGGMSSHGGMIGVALFTLWYARRHRISWFNIGDNIVTVTPIGLLFGRIANFINGELYGRVTSVPWAVQFPKELLGAPVETVQLALFEANTADPRIQTIDAVIAAAQTSPAVRTILAGVLSPRHPSQLYAAFLEGLVLLVLMWTLRTRVRLPNGALTGIFFLAYAVVRIVGEMFREPDAPLTGFLTRGQFLSLFLVIAGTAFLVVAWRKPVYPKK